MRYLHFYPQAGEHLEVWIAGEEEALRTLRDSIDNALADLSASAEAMAADGEGYQVLILKVSPEQFQTLKLPYGDFPGEHPFKLLGSEKYKRLMRHA